MPANTFNWAERIATAKENKTSFDPVPLGRMNFIIKEVPEVTQSANTGTEYIRFRAVISEGERANAIVFASTFPYAKNPVFFLELMSAIGISDEWFLGATPPTTEQIAQAMHGRTFSAEVHIEDGAKLDKSGHQYRSLKNYTPVAAVEAPVAQQAQQFGAPAAPAPQAQAPAPAPQAQGAWGNATAGPPTNVPAPDESPWGNVNPPNPFG